jgi:molybdopterin/thiamine biosynthesis adenylyltransferase
MASHVEVDAYQMAVDERNLPSLLEKVDVVIDCLDSVPRKKMLEEIAGNVGKPFLHGSVLREEGFAFIAPPSSNVLGSLYPRDRSGIYHVSRYLHLSCIVAGIARLMASFSPVSDQRQFLHYDVSPCGYSLPNWNFFR